MSKHRSIYWFVWLLMMLLAACATKGSTAVPEKETEQPSGGNKTGVTPLPAHRTGDFTLQIIDAQGKPLFGANVGARLIQHQFILGGQLPYWLLDPAYADKGDQKAVLQRADAMFEQIIPSAVIWGWVEPEHGVLGFSRYNFSASWTREHEKPILAQHIFWGLYDETHELNPAWLNDLGQEEFEAALYQRITAVQANVGQINGIVVLNEAMYQNIYNDRMGHDITAALFAASRAAFPNVDLYINENPWQAASLGLAPPNDLSTPIDNYIAYVQQLDQNGVDFDKVGIQIYLSQSDVVAWGTIDAFVAEVDSLLNRFAAETGHSLTITEYGLSAPDEQFRADFMTAFMQMAFANSNVDGFQVFHWLDEQVPNNALARIDGSLTLAGEAYLRQKEWWTTRWEGQTDELGTVSFTGVFGEYEIIVTANGKTKRFERDLGSIASSETTLIIPP